MRDINLPIIHPADSLFRGLAVIDEAGIEIALVTEGNRLVGVLTDGDARRALLRGKGLECPVADAMQRKFTTVGPEVGRAEVLDLMKARLFKQVPVVAEDGTL